jgi:hypothetical protein
MTTLWDELYVEYVLDVFLEEATVGQAPRCLTKSRSCLETSGSGLPDLRLLARGYAPTAEDAIKQLREARPSLDLSGKQAAFVRRFAARGVTHA